MGIKKGIIIPPYFLHTILAIAMLWVGMWLYQSRSDMSLLGLRNTKIIIYAGFFLLIRSCLHFSIWPKGILVHFLLIPVRWIPWIKVATAEYLHEWTTNGKSFSKRNGQGIAITLQGCDPFCPEIDGMDMFMLKHPFGFRFIRFTSRKQKLYVSYFKKYYPVLEFQAGSEEILGNVAADD